MKINRILVATDFSVAGNRAVEAAAGCARRLSAALRIVHVAPSGRQLAGLWRSSRSAMQDVQRQAAVALRRLTETIDPARQLELSTGVITGPATRKIASSASEYDADMLVIGAHGEHEMSTGQPGLGGTANKLVASSTCPLWLVRKPPRSAPANVIAAVDLGEVSVSVLRWAGLHAAAGRLHVLHAYEVPFASRLEAYGFASDTLDIYTEDEQERLDRELTALLAEAGCDPDVNRIIERGDAASSLFTQIQKLQPALVVVGKHGASKRRVATTKYGSVCRYAAFFSPTDVLVIPGPTSSG
ncbi:MAG: universal stress protein [Gammaproteobacteria bacterium]